MNIFAEDYARDQEIRNAYNAAADEDGKNAAIEAMRTFRGAIQAKGEDYAWGYKLYSDAQERGNEYIDISEPSEYRDEKALIDKLRRLEVERFTFSSGWSSAIDAAWEFQQNGCTLEGLVEINSQFKSWEDNGYQKIHGYLFKVN